MRTRSFLPLFFALLAGLLAALAPGCLSPTEPDTPRLRFLLNDTLATPPARHRIPCTITSVVVTENATSWACTLMDSTAEADTAAAAPAAWFRFTLSALPPFMMGQKYVASFTVRGDSIPADGSDVTLDGDPLLRSGVVFRIGKAVDSTHLQIIDSVAMDPATFPVSSLRMSHHAPQRRFAGQYNAVLTAYRFDFDLSFVLQY